MESAISEIYNTYPTANKVNRKQTEFYRKNDTYRAIAYFLDGYLNGLLDGHHKAVASALERRPLKTLVIIPTTSASHLNKNIKERDKGGISTNGVYLNQDEMITPLQEVLDSFKLNRISNTKTAEYLSKINNDFKKHEWDKDILSTEEYFPDPLTLARVGFAISKAAEEGMVIIHSGMYKVFCRR